MAKGGAREGAGRKRLPTRMKIINGSFNPSDDRYRKFEPNVHEVRVPPPPDHLTGHQKWAWGKFAEVLEPNRVTTAEDFASLEQLACAYSDMVLLRQSIRKWQEENRTDALVYEVVYKGGVERHVLPELRALDAVDKKLLTLLARFGLTPSDRSRVMMRPGGVSADPHDEFAHDPA